jgi:hypothetical protein
MMFGKSIFTLAKWAIVAGVAIVIGSQLLESVSWVVISFRFGNFMPLIGVLAVTFALQRISIAAKQQTQIVAMLTDVLASASAVYLFFVMLLGLLPYGLAISLIGSCFSIIVIAAIRSPEDFRKRISHIVEAAGIYTGTGIGIGYDREKALWNSIIRGKKEVLCVPQEGFNSVIDILKARPMLPVALAHYVDMDFLIVTNSDGHDWTYQVKHLLLEEGVSGVQLAPPLLKKVVLFMPLFEEDGGVQVAGYGLASSESSVNALLSARPCRMTVFPSSDGLRVVGRRDSVPGIEMKELPAEVSKRVVYRRDIDGVTKLPEKSEGLMSAN